MLEPYPAVLRALLGVTPDLGERDHIQLKSWGTKDPTPACTCKAWTPVFETISLGLFLKYDAAAAAADDDDNDDDNNDDDDDDDERQYSASGI